LTASFMRTRLGFLLGCWRLQG